MSGMRKLMESIGWSADDDEDISYYADDDPEHVDFDHQSPHDEDEFRPEDDRLGHNDPDRGNVEEGRDVREMTNKLHQYMDEGMLDPRVVADAALSYLSESDVADLARTYELIWDEDEEDEDEEDEEDWQSHPGGTWGLGEDPWGLGDEKQTQNRSDWENVDTGSISIEGVDTKDYPDFVDAFSAEGYWMDGTEMTEDELYRFDMDTGFASENAYETLL